MRYVGVDEYGKNESEEGAGSVPAASIEHISTGTMG